MDTDIVLGDADDISMDELKVGEGVPVVFVIVLMPDAAEMFCLGVGTGDNDIISLCSVEMFPLLLPFDRQCLIGLSELDGPGV